MALLKQVKIVTVVASQDVPAMLAAIRQHANSTQVRFAILAMKAAAQISVNLPLLVLFVERLQGSVTRKRFAQARTQRVQPIKRQRMAQAVVMGFSVQVVSAHQEISSVRRSWEAILKATILTHVTRNLAQSHAQALTLDLMFAIPFNKTSSTAQHVVVVVLARMEFVRAVQWVVRLKAGSTTTRRWSLR